MIMNSRSRAVVAIPTPLLEEKAGRHLINGKGRSPSGPQRAEETTRRAVPTMLKIYEMASREGKLFLTTLLCHDTGPIHQKSKIGPILVSFGPISSQRRTYPQIHVHPSRP